MRRREFLGAAAGGIAWSVVAHAQQQAVPLIGFLSSRSPEDSNRIWQGFSAGLRRSATSMARVRGSNIAGLTDQYDQLRKLAGELAELRPAIIAAAGGAPSARAAKSVTTSIPITFVAGDSVSEGVVANSNQPGGNITGVDLMSGELTGKRLESLAQLLPAGGLVGFLTNTKSVLSSLRTKDFELAAPAMGREALDCWREHRRGNRKQFHYTGSETRCRTGRRKRSVFRLAARASHSVGGAACTPGDLSHT